MKGDSFRERLLEEMETIRTVDCHSHTHSPEVYYKEGPYDIFNLMAYFNRQVLSSTGLKTDELLKNAPKDVSPNLVVASRIFGSNGWEVLKGILARARNISFWRHNMIVYKHLFDLKDQELDDNNWHSLNERIKERTADPAWYDHVIKLCNLETQVKMIRWFEKWEPQYFTASIMMQPGINMLSPYARKSLEDYFGESFTDLSALKDSLGELAKENKKKGAVGIKMAHAYFRTLATEDVPIEKASAIYERALKGEKTPPQEVKAFQDHMIYFLADLAGENELAFQIHTGPLGTWGNIPDGNPLHLMPLIRSHPSTKFDLTHSGYPYSREMGMLGKNYPNVWLDMAWTYLVTMEGSRQLLSEWIDLVPGDRILGFGSDVFFPEMVYGHLLMARSCIADVLSEKVKRDFISEEAATDLANRMLRENPRELYHL